MDIANGHNAIVPVPVVGPMFSITIPDGTSSQASPILSINIDLDDLVGFDSKNVYDGLVEGGRPKIILWDEEAAATSPWKLTMVVYLCIYHEPVKGCNHRTA